MGKNVRVSKPWYSRYTHAAGKWARNRAADAITAGLRFVPGVSPYMRNWAGQYYKALVPYGKYKPYWSGKKTGSVRSKYMFSSNPIGRKGETGSNPPGPPTGSNPPGRGKKVVHKAGYVNLGNRSHRTHKKGRHFIFK